MRKLNSHFVNNNWLHTTDHLHFAVIYYGLIESYIYLVIYLQAVIVYVLSLSIFLVVVIIFLAQLRVGKVIVFVLRKALHKVWFM